MAQQVNSYPFRRIGPARVYVYILLPRDGRRLGGEYHDAEEQVDLEDYEGGDESEV